MVELRVIEDGEDGATGAGLGVGGGLKEPGDAGVEDSTGAHGAGLERADEGAAGEAIVGKGETGGAEGDDLRMGGGVGGAEDLVVTAAEDGFAVWRYDDRADRDLPCEFGGAGFGDHEVHEVEVGHDCESVT